MKFIRKISLYYHTLLSLKLQQVYWRVWYWFYRPGVAPHMPIPHTRLPEARWKVLAMRSKSMLGPHTFVLLNHVHTIPDQGGWNDTLLEKLWLYNLHYFDDLNSEAADDRKHWHIRLINRWIAENPVGFGTGWESYPTSLRVVNWIKWQMSGNFLSEQCLQSLVAQVSWLSKRIEWHILGNHLFANAKAMVFAGIFFKSLESTKWMDAGLNIIDKELTEQVLEDGGNFERSPMYHAIFLVDLLDLINLVGMYQDIVDRDLVDRWRMAASKMLEWLEAMCHPDGEIAFFNDAAIGIAPPLVKIQDYASQLKIFTSRRDMFGGCLTAHEFPISGYIRLDEANAVAFLDVAPIGPDYLPGHAHADTLSFELSLFGERVFVNGGTSQYSSGLIRNAERGTAAHNTVEINGDNSSEIWAGFRVARRAYPLNLSVENFKNFISVSCSHNGYLRLSGRPLHRRNWVISKGRFVVQDYLDGIYKTAVARFHFHPDVCLTPIDCSSWNAFLPISGERVKVSVLKGSANIEQGFYSPEFGIRIENKCLAVQFDSENNAAVEILWGIDE